MIWSWIYVLLPKFISGLNDRILCWTLQFCLDFQINCSYTNLFIYAYRSYYVNWYNKQIPVCLTSQSQKSWQTVGRKRREIKTSSFVRTESNTKRAETSFLSISRRYMKITCINRSRTQTQSHTTRKINKRPAGWWLDGEFCIVASTTKSKFLSPRPRTRDNHDNEKHSYDLLMLK